MSSRSGNFYSIENTSLQYHLIADLPKSPEQSWPPSSMKTFKCKAPVLKAFGFSCSPHSNIQCCVAPSALTSASVSKTYAAIFPLPTNNMLLKSMNVSHAMDNEASFPIRINEQITV